MTHFCLLWLQKQPSKYKLSVITALMPAEKCSSAVGTVGRRKTPIMRSGALAITTFSFPQLCHHRLICMSGTHGLFLPTQGRSVSLKDNRSKEYKQSTVGTVLKNLSCWVKEEKHLVWWFVRRLDTNLRAYNGVGSQVKFLRAHKKGISKNRKHEGRYR